MYQFFDFRATKVIGEGEHAFNGGLIHLRSFILSKTRF